MSDQLDASRFDFDSLFATPVGEDLPNDAPGDDRADAALQSRAQSFQQADDLNWLQQGTQQPPEPRSTVSAGRDTGTGLIGLAGATAADLGMGAVETPNQIIGGMRDAVQSTIDFGETLEELMPLGGLTFTDEEGNFSLDYKGPEEWRKLTEGGKIDEPDLPIVREPTAVTSGAIRGISQFLTGFGLAGKAMGGLQGATKVGTVARLGGGGAAADFLAFGGQQERLSNLVESVPELGNPITEYLAADTDDTEIEGRLKNSIEGLGLGALSGALFKGLKAYRRIRAVQQGKNADKRIADVFRMAGEEQFLREAGEMSLIGRATDSAPLVFRPPQQTNAAFRLAPATHDDMGIPKPSGVDDRVYSIERGGERVGFANIRVKNGEAEIRDIFNYATLENANSFGPAAMRSLMRQFIAENPDVKVFTGERVSGARRGGQHGLAGSGVDVRIPINNLLHETETGVPTDVAARSLTTRGLTPLNAAGDVYVNFAKIAAPEDIQRIIKDTSSAFAGSVDEARRGVRTNAETLLSAGDVDAWNVLLTRRTGQPLNAEQSVAARELWAAAANKLGEVANVASQAPTPENLFQFRRMLATFHGIQKEVIGARTETARALQSWAMPVGGNLERMRDMTAALEQAGGLNESADLARRFAAAANLNDGRAAVMSNLAEKTFYQKALGSVQEYWINALLSGPKTHMVNIMSNSAVAALSAIERGGAARIGRLLSDDAGVEIGEGLAMADGIRGGIIDAFRNAGKALVTGETGYGINKLEAPRQRYVSSGTWGVRSNSWLGMGVDALGTLINVPGKLLQAEDEFFKTIGYRMELHAQATRMVQREVREGRLQPADAAKRRAEILDNPPEAIRMEAVANAAYQTFTSEPGKLTKLLTSGISKRPELKFILPFVNTPMNILKYTFERTPLAPLSGKYRAAIAEGGAKADLARTKMALGTMGMMYAIDLGMQGITTGSGPAENRAEMQNWRRQGNQPYSIRFGDKSIAFNRLDPLGSHLSFGADIGEYLLNAPSDGQTMAEAEEAMSATVFAISETIASKSYMQGLALLMEAINEPKQFAAAYIEKFAGSFIPTGVAEIARTMDPVQRQSHDIITTMKRRLPGYSETLPPRRDLWGRPIAYQSGFGTAYDAFSPLYGSTYRPEPIDKLMQEDAWFVGMGQNYFKIEGETVSLRNRPVALSRFHELRGATKPSAMEADSLLDKYGDNTLLETLNAIVTGQHDLSSQFEELENPEEREDFVKDIVSDYRSAAKERLFLEFPELLEMATKKKAARNK